MKSLTASLSTIFSLKILFLFIPLIGLGTEVLPKNYWGEWKVSKYNDPDYDFYENSFRISSKSGRDGLYFTRENLNQKSVYYVSVVGDKISEAVTLRYRNVTTDQSKWLSAPDGKIRIRIEGAKTVEILVYSDMPFNYRLYELKLEACEECERKEQLVNVIEEELGDLTKLISSSELIAAEKLLRWVSPTIDFVSSGASKVDTETYSWILMESASSTYFEKFLNDSGAVYCAGAAVYFKKVLEEFNLNAITLNYGDDTMNGVDDRTHVTTLLAVLNITDQSYTFYPMDPTFNAVYRHVQDGRILSFSELFLLVSNHDYDQIYIDSIPFDRDFVSGRGYESDSSCKPFDDDEEFFICERKNYDVNDYISGFTGTKEEFLKLIMAEIFSVNGKVELIKAFNKKMKVLSTQP